MFHPYGGKELWQRTIWINYIHDSEASIFSSADGRRDDALGWSTSREQPDLMPVRAPPVTVRASDRGLVTVPFLAPLNGLQRGLDAARVLCKLL